MSSFWNQVQSFFWNVFHRPQLIDILDIIFVAVLVYYLIMLTRETRASAVIKGLMLLVFAYLVCNLLGLTALSWILNIILSNGAVVLIILFQPELRKILEQIGRGARLDHFIADSDENNRIISEITQCLLNLSRRRVGALIVFERHTGLKDILETGTQLDSEISAPLLENIFEPNTPLHDGAVIIRGHRIMAGACVLTLSESNSITRDLGTRHRAAIGVSETTDALAFIVSEETGIISVARAGKLTRHLDAKAIGDILATMYHEPGNSVLNTIKNWLKGRKKNAE